MKHGSTRLASYVCLAAGPAVATSSAIADTYTGSGAGPITATAYNPGTTAWAYQKVTAFTAASLQFQAFATNDAASYGSGGAWFQIDPSDRAAAGDMRFYLPGSASRVIAGTGQNGTDHDAMNSGYAGFSTWGAPFGLLSANSSGYLGFSVTNDDTVNGFIQYSITTTADTYAFTILSWAYNVNGAITMPANSGAPAVPGLGGLAALAFGAAGVRRKRTRVA